MPTEIEKKFTVKQTLWNKIKSDLKGVLYRQGYLLNSEQKTIRVRIVGDEQAFLTIKGMMKGLTRPEYEYAIPIADARELLGLFCNTVVSKLRYQINLFNRLWEVDEFLDDNEGLVMAEIELDSEQDEFQLPDWIASEVTEDMRYYNSYLALHPFKQWSKERL